MSVQISELCLCIFAPYVPAIFCLCFYVIDRHFGHLYLFKVIPCLYLKYEQKIVSFVSVFFIPLQKTNQGQLFINYTQNKSLAQSFLSMFKGSKASSDIGNIVMLMSCLFFSQEFGQPLHIEDKHSYN